VQLEILRSLLVSRFQSLDEASVARLEVATSEAIAHYLERLPTADSLAAVFEE
jgi:hypothetical protein